MGTDDGRPDLDGRLRELEIRNEFQARTVDDLDSVVREFAERVARLERDLKDLRRQLELLGGDEDALPAAAAASDPS